MENSYQLFGVVNLDINPTKLVINPLYLESVSSIYEAINDGDWVAIPQYFSRQTIDHQLYPCTSEKIISYRQFFCCLKTIFPDMKIHIESIYSFGCKVVCRYTICATQEGTILHIPPAHQEFTFQGIDIFRFAGRKIVEHWGTLNLLPLLRQMENECHQLALSGYSEISD